jgi:lipopolysaccharide transport system permease protein
MSAPHPAVVNNNEKDSHSPQMRLMSQGVPLATLLSPVYLAATLLAQRGLLVQFVQRELLARNRGSSLGIFWTLLQPLLMLCVYTFVFAVVWKARWGSDENESNVIFASSVFCGLIVFDIFGSTVGAAPTLIINNANFVKKVIFPLELLPLAQLGAALCTSLISIIILVSGNAIFGTGLWMTVLLLPLILLPVIMFSAGVAWIISALGVFLRDLKQIVAGLLLPVLFFVTPVFYPSSRVPEAFAWILAVNPLAPMVENVRRVTLQGVGPDWPGFFATLLIGYVTFQAGYAFFAKSKRGFADVI